MATLAMAEKLKPGLRLKKFSRISSSDLENLTPHTLPNDHLIAASSSAMLNSVQQV
jgi:hypothetical protein